MYHSITPSTFEITDQTQLADWKKWLKSYRSFALANNMSEQSHYSQLSSFKSLLGPQALNVFRSFSIVDTADVESVIAQFDKYFEPKVNVTRERYKLYKLSQKAGQRFDDFLSDVTNQVNKCGFRSMHDEIILYKIVGGIDNDDIREALLADENLLVEKAIKICRASGSYSGNEIQMEGDMKEQRNPVKVAKRRLLHKHKKGTKRRNIKPNLKNANDDPVEQGTGLLEVQEALSVDENPTQKVDSVLERNPDCDVNESSPNRDCMSPDRDWRPDDDSEDVSPIDNSDVKGGDIGGGEQRKENFPCEVCGKVFPSRKNVKLHSLIHLRGKKPVDPEGIFPCENCGKVFSNKIKLRFHRRIHAERKFTCYYCEEKFALKRYVKNHMLRKHAEVLGVVRKVHECDQCDYKTTEWRNMRRHMYKHSDVKPLSCELCNYQCIVRSQMISHMAKHTGDKPFSCTECDFSTRSESSLLVHKRLKHGKGKPFGCKVCGSAFTLKAALRTHMFVHTGERPFACTLCDSKFKQSSHLSYHMRTHTGEKPYICDICGHRWATQGNLTAHIKTHNKPSDLSQHPSPRKRQKKAKPEQAVEPPAPATIPQWSEQITTINPVECFTGLEPYQAYPLGSRPAGADCRYFEQRPSQWSNSQNVTNVLPVIASDEFQ